MIISIITIIISLLLGDRVSLARAITLIESKNDKHQIEAAILMDYITNNINRKDNLFSNCKTLRLGVAGPPGAGKSTFIEALGKQLITKCNLRVAVLAVDPTSHVSGGSILGDKTRMEFLSRNSNAYVRASPTRGVLGGIAEYTSDIILLCEAAQYDVVIVESVGLGQSEVDIDKVVDMSVLLIPPGAGDSLQASKKGIMEAADIVIINKADGEQLPIAQKTKADYAGAMHFIRQKNKDWHTPVIMISSKKEEGLEQVEKHIRDFHRIMINNHNFLEKRKKQILIGLHDQLGRITINDIYKNSTIIRKFNNISNILDKGKSVSIRKEAFSLFDDYKNSSHN